MCVSTKEANHTRKQGRFPSWMIWVRSVHEIGMKLQLKFYEIEFEGIQLQILCSVNDVIDMKLNLLKLYSVCARAMCV